MKNVFIEGIQGSGKSTLTRVIQNAKQERLVCREGDYSPVDLAWCTWMTKEEYDAVLLKYASIREEIEKNTFCENGHFIITYTKILTDEVGFHKDLESYEIYNGRCKFDDWKKIVYSRFQQFQESKKDGYLFECAFFQNIMEDLILFHKLSDDEIIAFYQELYDFIEKENFVLLYLYSDNLEESIDNVRKERVDGSGNEMWYPLMLRYLVTSPYGMERGYEGFDDLIAHFKHRQSLELRVIEEVLKDNAVVLKAKDWAVEEILELI